jgi:hypothetical protein
VKLLAKIDGFHRLEPLLIICRKFLEKNQEEGQQRLVAEFFSEDPVCDNKTFRSSFGLSRPLFLHIVDALDEWSLPFSPEGEMFITSQDSHLCESVQQLFAC